MSNNHKKICLLFIAFCLTLGVQAQFSLNPAALLKTELQKQSLSSMRALDDGHLYTLEYIADYKLDELLQSNAKTADEIFRFVNSKLLSGNADFKLVGKMGCSAFLSQAKNGDILFSRNYDFRHAPMAVAVVAHPAGRYSSVGMADPSWGGFTTVGCFSDGKTDISGAVALPYLCMDGMNEKGLAIGVLQLNVKPTQQQDAQKKAFTTTVAIRLALDCAATVDEVVELWKKYNMFSTIPDCDFHFFVGDASGKSIVIEYLNNEMHVLDLKACANFPLVPEAGADLTKDHRLNIMNEVLAKNKGCLIDEDEAMTVLKVVRQEHTLWSTVYNLTQRYVKLSLLGNYRNTFQVTLP